MFFLFHEAGVANGRKSDKTIGFESGDQIISGRVFWYAFLVQVFKK